MPKTNYQDVYQDTTGQFYYEVSLGTDNITGKRIKRKGRKSETGKKFSSAKETYAEAVRIKHEFLQSQGYSNYGMTFEQFMNSVYIPHYRTEVTEDTFESRNPTFKILLTRFGSSPLRKISLHDIQFFRTWLLDKNTGNYSKSYASVIFGTLKKILDFAVSLNYLEKNVAHQVKSIPKGHTDVPYWTKDEFESVLSNIYIDDFYEHLCFVMLWVYYMTGVRVNEGTALWWNDIDFENKQLRVHHMLIAKSRQNYKRNNHTKTENGKRILTLDDDTIEVLKIWKKRQAEHGDMKFVFSYDGLPMIKSTIGRIITRYAKLADAPNIQAKGLRHSHVSFLINEVNASVLIISKRLGHSSPEITLKHYAHLWHGIDTNVAQSMSGIIKLSTSPKKQFKFSGNQTVSYSSPKLSPTEIA